MNFLRYLKNLFCKAESPPDAIGYTYRCGECKNDLQVEGAMSEEMYPDLRRDICKTLKNAPPQVRAMWAETLKPSLERDAQREPQFVCQPKLQNVWIDGLGYWHTDD